MQKTSKLELYLQYSASYMIFVTGIKYQQYSTIGGSDLQYISHINATTLFSNLFYTSDKAQIIQCIHKKS